jgi:uncharacterized protein (UPF0335 family)
LTTSRPENYYLTLSLSVTLTLQDLESTKRDIQEQLKSVREEIDSHMFEWRANRKLSLQLRDLVAEGKAEEATSIAEQQVESYLAKLLTDTSFRWVRFVV